MIQMPKRSVTRFFIPLIDVLTLLFCIFLLMPLVKATPEKTEDKSPGSAERRTAEEAEKAADAARKQLKELEHLLEAKSKELGQLQEQTRNVLQEHTAVRVLEIDAQSGDLYCYGPDPDKQGEIGRIQIKDKKAAGKLISADRDAIGESKRELYYAIQYPRDPGSPRPFVDQKREYNEWFKEVAHGWDKPGEFLSEVKP